MILQIKRGNRVIAESADFSYSPSLQEVRKLTCEVVSVFPIEFKAYNSKSESEYDTVVYNGNTFILYQAPSGDNLNEAGKYKYSLLFYGKEVLLQNVAFLDIVSGTGGEINKIRYTHGGLFQFWGDAKQLAARIEANIESYNASLGAGYTGIGTWTLNVDAEGELTEDMIDITDGTNLFEALKNFYDKFYLNYYFSTTANGGIITITDKTRPSVNWTFKQGDGGGAVKVSSSVDTSTPVITRIIPQGGSRNVPPEYKKDAKPADESRYCPYILLPNDSDGNIRYYIDSEYGLKNYGVRGKTISNTFSGIYPSIRGKKLGDLYPSGLPEWDTYKADGEPDPQSGKVAGEGASAATRIDKIIGSTPIKSDDSDSFFIYMTSLGFNLGYKVYEDGDSSDKINDNVQPQYKPHDMFDKYRDFESFDIYSTRAYYDQPVKVTATFSGKMLFSVLPIGSDAVGKKVKINLRMVLNRVLGQASPLKEVVIGEEGATGMLEIPYDKTALVGYIEKGQNTTVTIRVEFTFDSDIPAESCKIGFSEEMTCNIHFGNQDGSQDRFYYKYASVTDAVFSMRTGTYTGTEFKINKNGIIPLYGEVNGDTGETEEDVAMFNKGARYKISCYRTDSDNGKLPLYTDGKSPSIAAGTEFVILNIVMPESYVTMAENTLEKAALDYLSRYDHENRTVSLDISSGFVAEHPNLFIDFIEGNMLKVRDDGIGVFDFSDNGQIVDMQLQIQSLEIKYSKENMFPSYSCTIARRKILSFYERLAQENQTASTQNTTNVTLGGSGTGSGTNIFSEQILNDLIASFQKFNGWFEWDEVNQALRCKSAFYTNQWISALGAQSGSGGGSGVVNTVYSFANLTDGTTFSDSDLDNTFNAYTIKKLYDMAGQGGLDADAMWAELKKADSSKIIDASHIPTSVLDGRWVKKTGDTMTGTLTSASTSGAIVFKGVENCDITNIYKDNGVIKNDDGGLTSIRNGLRFNWYDTYWYIGNLRGSSTESAGFGVVDHNNKLVLRVTPNDVRAPRFMSTVATGVSPLIVSSNTLVNNLNSNYLQGYNYLGFIHSNYSASTGGTAYVSGDTHIMLVAEINIDTIYSTYVILLSNEYWGHQHYSALQLHIACTNNDNNGNKSPRCSVNVMSMVGSLTRSVYYKVENNKAYIFIEVWGGNNYGRWASTILQNYDSITTNNANTTGNITLRFAFNQSNSGLSDASYVNYISSTGLATSRTLWGQPFNGTANVSGDMTGVGSITMSGQLTSTVASGTAPFIVASNTVVGNLNADLLDGLHAERFLLSVGRSDGTFDLNTYSERAIKEIRTTEQTTNNAPFAGYGLLANLWDSNKFAALQIGSTSTDLFFRGKHDDTNKITSAWHKLLHTENYASIADGRYVKKSGDIMTGDLTMNNTKGFNIGWSTRVVKTSSVWIHGGGDTASSTDANLRFASWYGIGWYPTIDSTSGVRQGNNAMWLNVRTGELDVHSNITSHKGYLAANLDSARRVVLGGGGSCAWIDSRNSSNSVLCHILLRDTKVVIGNYAESSMFVSTVGTGTQPYQCNSTTLNTNLNADLLDGNHGAFYQNRVYDNYVYQYNKYDYIEFLRFVIPSGQTHFAAHVIFDLCRVEVGGDMSGRAVLRIKRRSDNIADYTFYVTNFGRSWLPELRCTTDDGITWRVWMKCTKTAYDPYIMVKIVEEYPYGSVTTQNNGTTGTPSGSKYTVVAGIAGLSNAANILVNTRNIFGQQFNGSRDVGGQMTSTSIFVQTGDATLKVYSGRITDAISDGNICLQTSIDATDGQSHSYPTQYQSRCNLSLQPRGGQVYIGQNPDGGDTGYKLTVNGSIKSNGNIIATGAITAKASSSDIRLKTDIQGYDAMGIIRKFQSVKYHWNAIAKENSEVFNHDNWNYGLIAQDLLSGGYSQWVKDAFNDYYTIDYERLIPVVWKGLQEVDDEVTKLKKRVKELEKRLGSELLTL